MMPIDAILRELQTLLDRETLPLSEAEALSETFAYEPLQYYLKMLLRRAKPETAASELFKAIAQDVLRIETFPEVSVKGGFIDFALEQKGGNPILLELKPLLTVEKAAAVLKAEKLQYPFYQAQIQKYLAAKEYVLLTNLREVCLFSREALITYAPFYQTNFIAFLREYLAFDTLWDYIRRLEDQIPRKALDQAFFADLKKWYHELSAIALRPINGLTPEELIVLFLNKIIFIKTLEDYGLIPFKFLEETYLRKRYIWSPRGDETTFHYFFDEIESWFYLFYDTDLFSTKFWAAVVRDPANLACLRQKFEAVVGFGTWQQAFGKGMIHYNYRLIDEDVFGKAYETFLAENRKDTGIYYTPQPLTRYMAEQLAASLFDDLTAEIVQALQAHDYDRAQQRFDQLQQIRIIDPCSGSGSFLIKVLRAIYARYDRIKAVLDQQAAAARQARNLDNLYLEQPAHIQALDRFLRTNGFNEPLRLIGAIILHHVYALDLDERALETAKVNLWKEAVKLDPRSFGFTKLPQTRNHALPSLDLNFSNGDSLLDLPSAQALDLIARDFRESIRQMHVIRDAYLRNPFDPSRLPEIRQLKAPICERLRQELPDFPKPVFMAVEFFFCYFDRDGQPLPPDQQGFDAVISNPPWEAIKPVKKEFADIGKGALDIQDFDKLFTQRLKTDSAFQQQWAQYAAFYERYRHALRSRYAYQGAGDLNYYKLFLERDLELLKAQGVMSLLIPSGIQTDDGTADLRRLILTQYRLLQLYSFENKGYQEMVNGSEIRVKLFPDVHPQFKFSILSVKKEQAVRQDQMFNAKFYLHHPDGLDTKPIRYSQQMVEKFSPDNLSIMEFRTEDDYRLCAKIRADHALLGDLGIVFRREFHMTDDSGLFKKEKTSAQDIVLYEGKMIHQYNAHFESTRYYIDETEGKNSLFEKKVKGLKKALKISQNELEAFLKNEPLKLDCEDYKLVYRDVGSSTNERTLISTILPHNVFTGNTLTHLINFHYEIKDGTLLRKHIGYPELVYLMALLNSLALNYYIRNKISAHISMFYAYELPIPAATDAQKTAIIQRAFALLAHHAPTGAFAELGAALGVAPETPFDPIRTRAALEVLIARDLYGLTAADWQYLTATFVYGSPASATRQELDQIVQAANGLFR